MEKLLELLKSVKKGVDFETCTNLVETGILDSLEIIEIVDGISREFGVELKGEDIDPDNFESAERMWEMIQRYNKGKKAVYKTKQENFWAGKFGEEYIERNENGVYIAGKIAMFAEIFSKTAKVESIIEFGSNIGANLVAINKLMPSIRQFGAIEINERAAKICSKNMEGNVKIYQDSILECNISEKYDVALVCGVLIHINPDELQRVYQKLYDCSNRYIIVAEYYNPMPVTVNYRGNSEYLFKRDFAGEILDKFKNVSLVDYGFRYHRDRVFPQDDLTWFLLEKQ